jgi:DNA repair protein RadC
METKSFLAEEIQITYRYKVKPSQRPTITTGQQAYEALLSSWNQDIIDLQEQFKILLLYRASKLLGIFEVSTGSACGTIADPKRIFVAALKANAVSIILCHNHPSGSLIPSKADEDMTHKIKTAGKYLDIQVLDHLIITSEGFYSFCENGIF